MKIYTKGGDQGETGLWGGDRVPKDHLRIRAEGALDELNAVLGVALSEFSETKNRNLKARLLRIQGELFLLGAEIATPRRKQGSSILIQSSDVERLEKEIDAMEAKLKPLKNFILPGGGKAGALLHLARTVARRVERELIPLHRAEPLRPVVLQYLNRLSDALFVCARFANHALKYGEIPWIPPRESSR